ncbi:MAG: hypothetical protein R3D26_08555, partial [Cyanobacteriota/Melainabacteria group bacterium]
PSGGLPPGLGILAGEKPLSSSSSEEADKKLLAGAISKRSQNRQKRSVRRTGSPQPPHSIAMGR